MPQVNVAGTEVEEIWVSGPELCRRLGISRTTVRRLRQRGLPSVGTYRLRRYHLPTVVRWMAEHA